MMRGKCSISSFYLNGSWNERYLKLHIVHCVLAVTMRRCLQIIVPSDAFVQGLRDHLSITISYIP